MQNPSTPECQECNLLIEKLLNLKPDKFPTLLKELQTSVHQTKQTSPPNPTSIVKPTQKEQITPSASFQSGKPSQESPKKRPSRPLTNPPLSIETSLSPKERTQCKQEQHKQKCQDKSHQWFHSRHKRKKIINPETNHTNQKMFKTQDLNLNLGQNIIEWNYCRIK